MSKDLLTAIQQAVAKSGKSLRDIAAEADMDIGQLSRLLGGERGIRLDTLTRLLHVLKLTVQPARKKK